MRVIPSLLTLTALAVLSATQGLAQAREANLLVQGMLVVASNKPGATDAKLAPYEPNLKKVLRFESYRSAGEGSAALTLPGQGTIQLAQGHRLEIEGLTANANVVRLRVKWIEDKRELMNTTLRLVRGTPAVLGGPPAESGGEVLAIIVLVL